MVMNETMNITTYYLIMMVYNRIRC